MRRLFLGTGNTSKLNYLKSFFDGLPIEFVTPQDLGFENFEAKEEANTARENAIEKAQSWYSVCKIPVLTLDAGLVFLDLPADHPDQPGVHVRRADGHNMTDEELLNYFVDVVHHNGGLMRAAWQDAYCILNKPEDYSVYEFTFEQLENSAVWFCDHPSEKRVPFWPLNSLEIDPASGKLVMDMTEGELQHLNSESISPDSTALRTWLRDTAMHLPDEN